MTRIISSLMEINLRRKIYINDFKGFEFCMFLFFSCEPEFPCISRGKYSFLQIIVQHTWAHNDFLNWLESRNNKGYIVFFYQDINIVILPKLCFYSFSMILLFDGIFK